VKNTPFRFLPFFVIGVAMVGCSFLSELPKIQPQAKTSGFTVSAFTVQAMHPGVEMNLWKTSTYRLEIDALFPEGSHDFELFVDSISVPASLIRDRNGVPFDNSKRERVQVKFKSNRHFYRPGSSGAMTLPEETYAPSGVLIEDGVCWFTFRTSSNRLIRWDLGVPKSLPTIYAP
jgi:hypothetical protein